MTVRSWCSINIGFLLLLCFFPLPSLSFLSSQKHSTTSSTGLWWACWRVGLKLGKLGALEGPQERLWWIGVYFMWRQIKSSLFKVKYFIKEANVEDRGNMEEAILCRKVCRCPSSKEPLEATSQTVLISWPLWYTVLVSLLPPWAPLTAYPPPLKSKVWSSSRLSSWPFPSLTLHPLPNHIHAHHCSCQACSDDFQIHLSCLNAQPMSSRPIYPTVYGLSLIDCLGASADATWPKSISCFHPQTWPRCSVCWLTRGIWESSWISPSLPFTTSYPIRILPQIPITKPPCSLMGLLLGLMLDLSHVVSRLQMEISCTDSL